MGLPPPDYREGGYNEGFHTFTDRADANAMMRTKGPGWFIEETPLDDEDELPDALITYGDTVFPIGEELFDNGTKALPIMVAQHSIASTEKQLQSMLDQAGRMLQKNRADIAKASSA